MTSFFHLMTFLVTDEKFYATIAEMAPEGAISVEASPEGAASVEMVSEGAISVGVL